MSVITIKFEDLTEKKQQEILEAYEIVDYKEVFPYVLTEIYVEENIDLITSCEVKLPPCTLCSCTK